jgi:hypothetical protein
MPNTLGDSRIHRSGVRGGSPAAQRCADCRHKPHEDEDYCQEMIWQGDNEFVGVCGCGWEMEESADDLGDLGDMLARVFGGFGEVLEAHAHNLQDAIEDVRALKGGT